MQAELLQEPSFRKAYDWMSQQMRLVIGTPTTNTTFPFWAWHIFDGKNCKPDLRCTEFRYYTTPQVCLELEIPKTQVLLSDEEAWHCVLNDFYYSEPTSDIEFEIENLLYNALTPPEQEQLKYQSWKNIFDVCQQKPPLKHKNSQFIQATFWQLHSEQVLDVRYFNNK